MQHTSRDHGGPAELNHVIEQRIRVRTSGRIHNLHVEIDHERIVVRGSCGTHHVKQLALQAVLGVVEGLRVDLELMIV